MAALDDLRSEGQELGGQERRGSRVPYLQAIQVFGSQV